jgi:hypothetical protein
LSEEAHFYLSGFVNKQNFRYWSQANPWTLHEKPPITKRDSMVRYVSVGNQWALLFKNEAGNAFTVIADRFVEIVQHFFYPTNRPFSCE